MTQRPQCGAALLCLFTFFFISGCCTSDSDCTEHSDTFCIVGVCQSGRCVYPERDCSDEHDCTEDVCDEDSRACLHEPQDELCDDALFCNGPEICSASEGCVPGDPPDCEDGVDCTVDACDETSDSCEFLPDDDLCDDNVECTADICNALTGCANFPDDGFCDDGDVCTGVEICEPSSGCQSGEPLVCDDGSFCNGTESCDPVLGCQSGAPPDCDDGIFCTVDECDDSAGSCQHEPVDAACDDGLFCNGPEVCEPMLGCTDGTPPDCTEGNPCLIGFCDEETDACLTEPNDGALCDAGGGPESGRCFDGTCYARGCGDGFLEPGPTPPPEECDPGPVFTPGCPDGCESVDFRVSGVVPEAAQNGDQYLSESGRAVAPLDDGRLVVVYTRDIGTDCGAPDWPESFCRTDVVARIFSLSGATESEEIVVHADVAGRQAEPAVAPLGDGFVVVWSGEHLPSDSRGNIFARAFDAEGAPRRSQSQVNASVYSFQLTPAVAAVADGALVVWQGPLSSETDAIRARWLDDRGVPTADADLVVASSDWDWLWAPAVAVAEDGATALVVWVQRPGDLWEDDWIAGRLFDVATGEPLGVELVVAAPEDAVDYHEPTLTAMPGGGYFVAWRRTASSGVELEGRFVSSAGELFDHGALSTTPTERSYEAPTVTALADGTLTVAWTEDVTPSPDGWGRAIVATQLDLSGVGGAPALLESDVLLNTNTTDWQTTPHFAVTGEHGLGLCFTDESSTDGDDDPSQVRCRALPAGWVVE